MKFEVSTRDFNNALKMVATTDAAEIKLTAADLNSLEIDADGGVNSIHIHLSAEAVMEPGSVLLSTRFMNDIVKKTDDPLISIYSSNENGVVMIKSGKAKFKLNTGTETRNTDSLPSEDLKQFTFKGKLLSDLFDRVSYAAALKTTRPVLTGVNLSCEGSVLRAVATDSYRLAKAEVYGIKEINDFNITIPQVTVSALQSTLLTNEDESITVSTDEKRAFFSNGDITVGTRLLNEPYPDVARLIPAVFENSITVSRKEFQDVLERSMFLKSKDEAAVIHLMFSEKGGIKVSSDSKEIGSFEEDLEGTTEYPDIFSISFASSYMVDALKHIRKETVTVRFTGELKPFVIEDDEVVHLMLPIRRY